MSKRARLLSRVHGIDPAGIVWAVENGKRFPVYDVSGVSDDYQTLLAAAPLMFRSISLALPMLETINCVFETYELDAHVQPVMQLEAGLNVALRAAIDGLRKVADRG